MCRTNFSRFSTQRAPLWARHSQKTPSTAFLEGRDFTQLTVYTPGAGLRFSSSYGGSDSTERSVAGNEVSVNGNRQQSNNYLLDGQEINENINNTLGYNPSPDSLAQVRVIASNANAEFGNVNGGTVLAVMKSGSNSWHGSAFGFLKNYNLTPTAGATTTTLFPSPRPLIHRLNLAELSAVRSSKTSFSFLSITRPSVSWRRFDHIQRCPAAFRTGDLSSLLSVQGIQLYDTQTILRRASQRLTPITRSRLRIRSRAISSATPRRIRFPITQPATLLASITTS